MKVLSIGNSFSQDAHRYLHKIAKNENVDMKCVNLYIGGCSLETHYINMLTDKKAYQMEFNGENTKFFVSIKDALISDSWDVITLQQVSNQSPCYETYQPYLTKLAEYVRLYRPKAKIFLHQTWAYEQGSKRLNEELGFSDWHEMFERIENSYKKAAESISADGIIPCGKAMIKASENGIDKIHRDTFHADLGVGRYILGLTWFKCLTGLTPQNKFSDFDIEVDENKVIIALDTVKNLSV